LFFYILLIFKKGFIMKKFLAILVVAILATSMSYAGHNDPVTANAQFDVKVIQPLEVAVDNDGLIVLPDVIQGQIRTWNALSLNFAITGEADYPIDVTITGPTADAGNPSGALTLAETISAAPIALDASGQATVTWTCTGADATNAGTGTYKFSLEVEANYTGL
jgi:hypothetical protein